ncbi:MAG: tRNA threonylcarbamoyladenosine biosynthesis protein TsaB [Candidatus Atribacteria bacterium]|jgi:tRNA threonylcarbamoyl adenosine modification protein YeaZ|uniref:tRNA (adenosine(37)-N6)-threonylcarbamoyltransferase complex dimerization subunit type 1 TsaB n=1 Tax=Atrimonas thermophila TaxID=3064161 RepID=UPI0024AA604E|nr:tRNA threonylcarbamoyladenosine biosynthesis protein TsaB [Candidatus Atribacteria bacterium]
MKADKYEKYILAFDSSTPWLSVALAQGQEVKVSLLHYARENHSRYLFDHLEYLKKEYALQSTNLEAVIVGIGPGSFTGVKIGVCVAKAIAFGYQLPLVGFSTLESLALEAMRSSFFSKDFEKIFPIIHHKKDEIFWVDLDWKTPWKEIQPITKVETGNIQDFVAKYARYRGLVVSPSSFLKSHFEGCEGNLLFMQAFPQALRLIELYHQRGSREIASTENVFRVGPIYGAKLF